MIGRWLGKGEWLGGWVGGHVVVGNFVECGAAQQGGGGREITV